MSAAAVAGRHLLLLSTVMMMAAPVRPVRANRRYDHHVLGSSMAWPDAYDARSVIHSRFQMTRSGRVLVASPRYRPGVPFTLGSFSATAATRTAIEPDVEPLPPAPEVHRLAAANANATAAKKNATASACPLVNVVDLYLDSAEDVLWLLDVGVVDTMTDKPRRVAPAKIVRLEIDDDDDDDGCDGDTKKKPPYKTIEIKTNGGGCGGDPNRSCLQYIVVYRSRAAAGGHYAFVSDAGHSSVLVLDTNTGAQWPIEFPRDAAEAVASSSSPSSSASSASSASPPRASDRHHDVMFMVTLRKTNGRTALYATFLSGCHVFAVDLEHIDRCATARPAVAEVGRKPYRIAVIGSDAGSRMFFRRPAENEIWSWDVNGPFHPVGFRLVSRGQDCRAPVHVAPGYGGFVFVLRNNFADYVRNGTGTLGAYTLIQPVSVLPSTCRGVTAAAPPADAATNATAAAAANTTTAPTPAADHDCGCRL